MTGPAVRLEGVSYRYTQQRSDDWGLRDVSLEIGAGQCVVISGPSGAGKTTLLRCMNGLIPHFFPGLYQGRTVILGRETTQLRLAGIATRVGTVFQNPEAQLLTTIVEAEVAFGLENLGIAADEGRRRCEAALRLAGVAHLRGRLVRTLSGGEKQRLAIASVVAMQPPILLFDEPLSNVDPLGAREFLAQLKTLRAAGLTLIVVEQRVRGLLEIADRLIWLDNHAIVHDTTSPGTSRLPTAVPRMSRVPSVPEEVDPIQRMPGDVPISSNGHRRACPGAICVEFEGVGFRYAGGPEALRGINLRLEGGQWVSIIGKNGSGKTTLGRLVNGLLRPTAGRVSVCGFDTSRHPVQTLSRIVGYVFQNPLHSLHAPTVGEEVSVYPKNQGWPQTRMRRSVQWALAALELDGRAASSPFVLSAGEQQRVSIAAVIAGQPLVLILDEPTLGMSQSDLDVLRALIAVLTAQGRLVITTTHDLDWARQCDRVIALSDGTLFADGSSSEVLTEDVITTVFGR